MKFLLSRFSLLAIVNVLFLCVLGFYQTSSGQPRGPQPGLVNSASQRVEMIEQLKQINRHLAEQNQLLRSGNLKVVVTKPNAR